MRQRVTKKTKRGGDPLIGAKSPRSVELSKWAFCRWILQHPRLALVFISLAALIPFLDKPFNFDDPLFIWTARHIQLHPADPFGFDVNWYAKVMPMWQVTQNPPLASYFIALVTTVLGWSEMALHSAFLLPASLVILGTYRLARHFCERPLLAALATLLTPVFLVSSTTVMCDVLMLSFWVWAVVFWFEGWAKEKSGFLFLSGLLMGLATLTKYFGIGLVPLLLAYSVFRLRRWEWRLVWLLVPVIALASYEVWTKRLYGHGLFSQAMEYAGGAKQNLGASKTASIFIGLAFAGGSTGLVALLAMRFWTGRRLLVIGLAGILAALIPLASGMLFKRYTAPLADARLAMDFQFIIWVMMGLAVLVLAVEDFQRNRDSNGILLALWVVGTFVFASFFNWEINTRSVLPLTPAVAILLARRLNNSAAKNDRSEFLILVSAAGLALLVAWSDFRLAGACRSGAQNVADKLSHPVGTVWYQGHWGFQFYLDKLGLPAMDETSKLQAGDFVVVPLDNTCLIDLNPDAFELRETIITAGPRLLTTMSSGAGAGFYASAYGPLPFAFGAIAPEKVLILRLKSLQ